MHNDEAGSAAVRGSADLTEHRQGLSLAGLIDVLDRADDGVGRRPYRTPAARAGSLRAAATSQPGSANSRAG